MGSEKAKVFMKNFRHFLDASPTKTAYQPNDSHPTYQVYPRQKQSLKLAITLAAREFESPVSAKKGPAVWQVLFLYLEIK